MELAQKAEKRECMNWRCNLLNSPQRLRNVSGGTGVGIFGVGPICIEMRVKGQEFDFWNKLQRRRKETAVIGVGIFGEDTKVFERFWRNWGCILETVPKNLRKETGGVGGEIYVTIPKALEKRLEESEKEFLSGPQRGGVGIFEKVHKGLD